MLAVSVEPAGWAPMRLYRSRRSGVLAGGIAGLAKELSKRVTSCWLNGPVRTSPTPASQADPCRLSLSALLAVRGHAAGLVLAKKVVLSDLQSFMLRIRR